MATASAGGLVKVIVDSEGGMSSTSPKPTRFWFNISDPLSVFRALPFFAFAFGSQIQVPQVYRTMRNRTVQRMTNVFTRSTVGLFLIYGAMGTFGALSFPKTSTWPVGSDILMAYTSRDKGGAAAEALVFAARVVMVLILLCCCPLLVLPCKITMESVIWGGDCSCSRSCFGGGAARGEGGTEGGRLLAGGTSGGNLAYGSDTNLSPGSDYDDSRGLGSLSSPTLRSLSQRPSTPQFVEPPPSSAHRSSQRRNRGISDADTDHSAQTGEGGDTTVGIIANFVETLFILGVTLTLAITLPDLKWVHCVILCPSSRSSTHPFSLPSILLHPIPPTPLPTPTTPLPTLRYVFSITGSTGGVCLLWILPPIFHLSAIERRGARRKRRWERRRIEREMAAEEDGMPVAENYSDEYPGDETSVHFYGAWTAVVVGTVISIVCTFFAVQQLVDSIRH